MKSQFVFSRNLCAAYIAAIVSSFERQHETGCLGRTALQKLAYFSKELGVPIPCSFEIYTYGPYSDAITFDVDSLLADDVLIDTVVAVFGEAAWAELTGPRAEHWRLFPLL